MLTLDKRPLPPRTAPKAPRHRATPLAEFPPPHEVDRIDYHVPATANPFWKDNRS